VGGSLRAFRALDGDGALVGHVELDRVDRRRAETSLCRVLIDPARRGEGLCRPLVKAALAEAFERLGLRRVLLHVRIDNDPAARCYRACGFQPDGLGRPGVGRMVRDRDVDLA